MIRYTRLLIKIEFILFSIIKTKILLFSQFSPSFLKTDSLIFSSKILCHFYFLILFALSSRASNTVILFILFSDGSKSIILSSISFLRYSIGFCNFLYMLKTNLQLKKVYSNLKKSQ